MSHKSFTWNRNLEYTDFLNLKDWHPQNWTSFFGCPSQLRTEDHCLALLHAEMTLKPNCRCGDEFLVVEQNFMTHRKSRYLMSTFSIKTHSMNSHLVCLRKGNVTSGKQKDLSSKRPQQPLRAPNCITMYQTIALSQQFQSLYGKTLTGEHFQHAKQQQQNNVWLIFSSLDEPRVFFGRKIHWRNMSLLNLHPSRKNG